LQIIEAARLPLRGIPDRVINYPYWSRAVGAWLLDKNFDVVHAQGLSGWGYASHLRAGRAHAPLVMNPQGMEEFKTSPAKRLAYFPFRMLARREALHASALIAADSAAATEIPRFLNVPPSKVALIPNGIDVDACLRLLDKDLQRALVMRLRLQQRTPLLLSVGRLEANKGFDVLLDALARIRPSLPSKWFWLLVGDGPHREHLQSKIRALKLWDHAQLLGPVDDRTLHNLYELATLFIHPTLFEGSSLVTLEAMAHRRPIVATTVGGIPDKVLRGRNGFLVPPGDAPELGEKILLALRDSTRLREMGAQSFVIAQERFDFPRTIQQTLALYEAVTATPKPMQGQWLRLDSDAPVLS
jgi:glycosyltransferase involved in cell wall biosynthesis